MMHDPLGPDGERKWSWMTAGLLRVHGAEQGEALYGTDQPSASLTLPFISIPLLPHSQMTPKSRVLTRAFTLQVSTLTLKEPHCAPTLFVPFVPLSPFSSHPALSSIDSLSSPCSCSIPPSHCATLFSSETISVFSISLPCTAAV